jgi:hypothetical protein
MSKDQKLSVGKTTQVRPAREDMLAFVANGRQRPGAQWAICVNDRKWAICVNDRGEDFIS